MKVIDSDNYAVHSIETLFFPGGEPHVKIPSFAGHEVLFVLKARTWADVGFGTLLLDGLDRQSLKRLRVFVPYFPGARQDRSDGSCGHTLSMTTHMLAGNRAVYVVDGHSAALQAYGNIAEQFMPVDFDPTRRGGVAGIIAPDAGAIDRAQHFRDTMYPCRPMVYAQKERDPWTGRLSHYKLTPLPAAGHYIVVDDICDGGGTFNLLADAFARDPLAAQSSLELFVSHGIFSKGLDAISPLYTHITTTDSWCQLPTNDRLTVLPINSLYNRIMRA